ncbi:MAG: toll/interleukin-1 receptor domain-containing protein [Thermodesulfobacteriota bacterium]|nr:MAG: toll/interleukin-1 receptor domain-containing protein [Thermodesulfobacteriota bacterium]
MDLNRKLIFISHANPEDNEFTLWLVSRLSALGYLVWSDLTKLLGAEVFWKNIEDAIRNHAAKVIVVLTRSAQQKDGVLDEVNLAVSIERTMSYPHFVVPIRLDDLPFHDISPNLARKNIIDFSKDWAEGFGQLLKVLERDKVGREQDLSTQQIAIWIENIRAGYQKVVAEPQQLMTNYVEFMQLPENLNFYKVGLPNDVLRLRFQSFTYPLYHYQGMVATFASSEDMNDFLAQDQYAALAYQIPVLSILNNESHNLSELKRPEAVHMLSFLIRTAWDKTMEMKGLRAYELASGRKAWFAENGYRSNNVIKYFDLNGIERRKSLVGRSEKRKAFWHFAIDGWPTIGKEPTLMLRPHVVFTEDGKTQFSVQSRMHRLRRGFCRNWWNPRWRDLILAYTTMLSDEYQTIKLKVGSEQFFFINSRPALFNSPVSVSGLSKTYVPVDETDSQLDELSEGFGWDIDEENDDLTLDTDESIEAENRDKP